MRILTKTKGLIALTIVAVPSVAIAQSGGDDLAGLSDNALDEALQLRYSDALAATNDNSVRAANDARYLWAQEAKVQCAIAIGFRKSGTRDATSIRKCGAAYDRMRNVSAPPPVQTVAPPPQITQVCDTDQAATIFFDFDSVAITPAAMQTVDSAISQARTCGWTRFTLVGHADRSGSGTYNDALSMRRARAVADILRSRGLGDGQIAVSARGEDEPRVPTPDGVRNPQNRRVEINID